MADDKVKPDCMYALERAGWRHLTHETDGRVASLRWKGKLVVFDLHMRDDVLGRDMIVEVKGFETAIERTASRMAGAIGQFRLYQDILRERKPTLFMYLAVPLGVFREVFATPFGDWALRHYQVQVLAFPLMYEPEELLWYPHPPQ